MSFNIFFFFGNPRSLVRKSLQKIFLERKFSEKETINFLRNVSQNLNEKTYLYSSQISFVLYKRFKNSTFMCRSNQKKWSYNFRKYIPKKKLLQISGNGFRFFDDQYFVDRRSMDMLSLTGNDNYKTSTPKIMTTSYPLHNLICK